MSTTGWGVEVHKSGAGATRDRGAAAVELALVLPIFLLLIFGIMQYGWTFYQTQETAQAAREGARIASVGEMSTAELQTYVVGQILSTSVAEDDVTVCFTVEGPANGTGVQPQIGDEISVRITYSATDFNLPFLPFPNGLQIDETARSRAEDPPAANYPSC